MRQEVNAHPTAAGREFNDDLLRCFSRHYVSYVNEIIYNHHMAPRKIVNFRIDEDLALGLRRMKARDGIPESEQIRRGIRLWLKSKGIKLAGARARRG